MIYLVERLEEFEPAVIINYIRNYIGEYYIYVSFELFSIEKSCINLCLANIEHIYESDPLAVVEMFVTLICVLKDSADVSPILLDSFHDCQGYKFLTRILLTFSTRSDDQAHEASRNLVLLIGSLVTTGYSQVLPSTAISTPFQKSDYVIPKPSTTQGVSIRNLDAFKVLMDVFVQVSTCSNLLYMIQNTWKKIFVCNIRLQ